MPTMNPLKTTSSAARPIRLARLAAVAALLGGTTVGALAQYKIVGPDGKVTYTDETRQAMARYPVTLYSTKSCPSCDQARQALRARGVPFNEYAVTNESDFAVFKSRIGGTTFPVIAVGGQTLKGYSASDLSGYLDAAGYPAQARLTGYAWPAAMPLAPRGADTPAPVAAAPAPAPATPTPPPPANNGIQF
jgi:glutaredoxin